ncbi:transposase [Pyrenophora tritici-repentis]|uniref:Transposase n=1 Tax=Pyrenophora tritici-repentis TaxID=45151 RepID=A0A922NJ15_9PLEO|nr:transposase [Pyrenophora tritici-repentis]KAI1689524.1 transposase [Pyrenophora tritici-repentis]
MADKLLAARGAGQVRQKWPANFVKRTDSLRTCFNQAYDRQRALCENPALIRSWFELIEKTKAELSICDEDIYNFDEAGFIMGKITTQLVITGAERRGRPKTLQPGNREWVTLIAAISAAGWSVPPFLIFAGQYHLSAWYEEAEILRD